MGPPCINELAELKNSPVPMTPEQMLRSRGHKHLTKGTSYTEYIELNRTSPMRKGEKIPT